MAYQEFKAALEAQNWTQQEIDDLQALIVRATNLMTVHRLAKLEFAEAVARWNGGVSSKIASLGSGFEIPNPTDYAGTGDITKENLSSNIMAYVTAVYGLGTQGHLENLIPLCGNVKT